MQPVERWLGGVPGAGPAADPAALRAEVERIMSAEEYRYGPTPLERVGRFLAEALDRLLGNLRIPGTGSSFSGGAGAVVAWVVVVAAVVVAVAAVVRAVRRRVRRRSGPAPAPTVTEVEHRRRAEEWADEAARAEREGRWADAVRARYRELVRTLVDEGRLPDVAGLTTGELRTALRDATPEGAAAFDRASTTVEVVWYGGEPATGPHLAALRTDAAVVRRAVLAPSGRTAGMPA